MNVIPSPPPLPNYPGFDAPGYWRLTQSLPKIDLEELNKSHTAINNEEVDQLVSKINSGDYYDKDKTRWITEVALKALQQNKITVEQVASFHILDGAVRDLVTHVVSFIVQTFAKDGKIDHNNCITSNINCSIPYTLKKYLFSDTIQDSDTTNNTFLLKNFLNLNDTEWENFCTLMKNKTLSEQYYYTLPSVTFGCWSHIVGTIQIVMNCFQNQSLPIKYIKDFSAVNVMIIPSFSMFQIFVDVKAQTYGEESVQLIPTYNLMAENDYARVKTGRQIPVALYFPERNGFKKYDFDNKNFKRELDGYGVEGPFAVALHDIYHAIRELIMDKKMRLACYYLASLAEKHPKNKTGARSASNVLIDGELINSVSRTGDNLFPNIKRNRNIFGEVFYADSLNNKLDPELKKYLIQDMAVHHQEWKQEFGLGREDLRKEDQEIYDTYPNTL